MGGGGFLGLGPAPKAPPAPDYVGAANATAAGNLQAAEVAAAANRVNQYTPYGSLVYSQQGTDSRGNPMWAATTNLSPVGQQLLNAQNYTSLGLSDLLNTQGARVANSINQGFNPNLPSLTYSAGQADLGRVGQGPQFAQAGQAQQAQGVGQAQQAQGISAGPSAQTSVSGTGMEGWDKATALINQRLAPQMAQARENQAQELANKGIVPGTKAYENAMRTFNQGQNDLLTQAQLQGANVQNQMFNQNLQAGQFGNQALAQNFGQNLSAQQLQNQAAQQNYANQIAGTQLGNTAAQQNYANQLAGLGFNNQQAQQGYTNQLAALQANNAAAQQQYQNQLANANLSNAAQQVGYNQALNNYNLPLNVLSSLRTGAQVTNPTFQNVPQQATTAGADILGATTQGYNNQLAGFNAANAAQANLNSGLFGLAGAALISDIRAKENIEFIGMLPNGLPFYEFEYKKEFKEEGGEGRHRGVMAQDVEKLQPHAIIKRQDGYLMVNYGALNG